MTTVRHAGVSAVGMPIGGRLDGTAGVSAVDMPIAAHPGGERVAARPAGRTVRDAAVLDCLGVLEAQPLSARPRVRGR